MKVVLVNYTREPERAIINGTRLCYNSFDKQSQVSDENLLKHLCKGNESPLEHAVFSFMIQDISRACSHQIVRHRIMSVSQRSQRYCKEHGFSYVVPDSIENSDAKQTYTDTMAIIENNYNKLIQSGIKAEDARYLLPNACYTRIHITINARSLRNFLKLRLSSKAQWEIRDVARLMRDEVNLVAPNLVKDFFTV